MSHKSYNPIKINEYKDDWVIFPVNGYGNPDIVRQILDFDDIDAVWAMTDPRFYGWLFNMMDEIHDRGIPTFYYHVWDCDPIPKYNKPAYDSCSFIGCISKLTHKIVTELCGPKNCQYIPHGLDLDIFKPISNEERIKAKHEIFKGNLDNKFVLFYNSRNARRKMTSTCVEAFGEFAKIVGRDKVFFLMHSDPKDQEGADLYKVCERLEIANEQIAFSIKKISPEDVARLYNVVDATINVSNNEGFGLSCLESLACGRPVIVNKTGGLQDQVVDDKGNELGVCLEPLTRTLTGSQDIPYIYDDRNSVEQIVEGLLKLYNMSQEEKDKVGQQARKWVEKKFDKEPMIEAWDKAIMKYVKAFKEDGNPNRIKFGRV